MAARRKRKSCKPCKKRRRRGAGKKVSQSGGGVAPPDASGRAGFKSKEACLAYESANRSGQCGTCVQSTVAGYYGPVKGEYCYDPSQGVGGQPCPGFDPNSGAPGGKVTNACRRYEGHTPLKSQQVLGGATPSQQARVDPASLPQSSSSAPSTQAGGGIRKRRRRAAKRFQRGGGLSPTAVNGGLVGTTAYVSTTRPKGLVAERAMMQGPSMSITGYSPPLHL